MPTPSKRYYDSHREQRIADAKQRARRGRAIIDLAKAVPCSICGGTFPTVAMDLHHRDPREKDRPVGQMCTYSTERLLSEIAKCDVVCANCHRVLNDAAGYYKEAK